MEFYVACTRGFNSAGNTETPTFDLCEEGGAGLRSSQSMEEPVANIPTAFGFSFLSVLRLN